MLGVSKLFRIQKGINTYYIYVHSDLQKTVISLTSYVRYNFLGRLMYDFVKQNILHILQSISFLQEKM